MDDELYDDFLFHEEQSQYDRDLLSCTSTTQEEAARVDQDVRALDCFVGMLTKETKEYLLRKLTEGQSAHVRRTNYSALKNTDSQKEVRQTLLLLARLISKGDAQALIVDTAEDLHIAKTAEPFTAGYHKRKRTSRNKNDDLAGRLLTNLGAAYKHHTKKRSEKKRLLSIAATEITYAEGRRVFGCGPVQFSQAKKLGETFGPFSDGKTQQNSAESSSCESKDSQVVPALEEMAEQMLAAATPHHRKPSSSQRPIN